MKSLAKLLSSILILLSVVSAVKGQAPINLTKEPTNVSLVSLEGQALTQRNLHRIKSPALRLIRTKAKTPHGVVLLLPGSAYEKIKVEKENQTAIDFLNSVGYDVAILDYPVGIISSIRNRALEYAQKALKVIQANRPTLGLRGSRLILMGISAGGHLAARTVQRLDVRDQPDDLILISPSDLDETLIGTVFPAVTPPIQPSTRLFAAVSGKEKQTGITACREYVKTWIGYDGKAAFHQLKDSTVVFSSEHELTVLLNSFLSELSVEGKGKPNPAAVPVEGYSPDRHAEKVAQVAKNHYDLILIGNSITNNFEKPEYQPVWNQFFAPRNALNLGFSGYRTENLLWNIQNGELEGQSPKVIILEIGTNNIDEKNYPTRHTAGQLAGGIEAIVKQLREKCPESKIILLRCFPGCYGGPNPTSHRAILERASDLVSKIADNKHVFYCDVNHVFINLDGSINHDRMPDWLHPSPQGAKAWAQAMEPLLSELMGDQTLDTEIPSNTAVVPVPKLEEDSYNWWDRHTEVLQIKDSINPQIVLIGNSITHFWGGEPRLKYADGKPRNPNGPNAWDSVFGNYHVLNLGFGWDRTQNVLWRLDHGEMDGLHPRKVIIHIGTNNTSETPNARMNTADEIVNGIEAVCRRVRSKVPGAEIILMAIMPREEKPDHPCRLLLNQINQKLAIFAAKNQLRLINIGPKMLAPDGTLPRDIANDFCHPTEKGYQIWADSLRPFLSDL